MVCVPCFIIPVLLYVWHRFIQPYILRYWNPWAKKDKEGNVIPSEKTEFPFDCSGGKCTFLGKGKLTKENNSTNPTTDVDASQIKEAEVLKTAEEKKQE